MRMVMEEGVIVTTETWNTNSLMSFNYMSDTWVAYNEWVPFLGRPKLGSL